MVFSESLANRIRMELGEMRGVQERKMFGGIGFLLHGNLLVGVWQQSLVARVGAEQGEKALREPHVRPFDITGRPMRGWVLIDPDGLEHDDALAAWIDLARQFVTTLPRK